MLVVLWVCIGLFLLRVVGQIEVLLIAPTWLPSMSAWYSGLLPYYLLLPCQIMILMLMGAMALGSTRRSIMRPYPALVLFCGRFAVFYFVAMVIRLVVVLWHYGLQFLPHGAIPVAFHWVLALFLFVWASLNRPSPANLE